MTSRNLTELTQPEARRLAIHASALGRQHHTAEEVLDHLGIIQLDSINSVARAHQLTLGTRLPGLDAKQVDDTLWGDGQLPVAFEYMAHAASLVPIADWPLWNFRRHHTRTRDLDWRPDTQVQARLIGTIADRGPLTMRELRGEESPSQGWSWGPTKTAVEYLLWTGQLVCVTRRRWHRVFDLPERTIPAHLLKQEPDDHTALTQLLTKAGRAMGISTTDDLADYLRISKDRVLSVIEDTPLQPARVTGWADQAWIHPAASEHLDHPTIADARFIGPFDNLIWHRPRVRRLFGFDHILEAYKPASKRQYGYYAMPLLHADRLVARADMKVAKGELQVLAFSREDQQDVHRPALDQALQDLLRFAGATTVTGIPALP
ncbi:hypothetical protein ATKI12_8858 [Kitasatospora sp. Ki12]